MPTLAIRPPISRHEFYETDEKITISIFDRGADPAELSIQFHPRKVFSLLPVEFNFTNFTLPNSSIMPMATRL